MFRASSLGIMALSATGPSCRSCRTEASEVGIALQGVSGCLAASSSVTWITRDLPHWGIGTAEYQAFPTPLINQFGLATTKASPGFKLMSKDNWCRIFTFRHAKSILRRREPGDADVETGRHQKLMAPSGGQERTECEWKTEQAKQNIKKADKKRHCGALRRSRCLMLGWFWCR